MAADANAYDDLRQLMLLAWDNLLSTEDFGRLEQLLICDTAARQFYLEESDLYGTLCWNNVKSLVAAPLLEATAASIGDELAVAANIHRTPAPLQANRTAGNVVLGFLARTNTALNRPVFWAILAVGTFFYGTFTFISWNLRPDKMPRNLSSSVATIGAAVDVNWSPDATPESKDSSIRVGESLKIESGLMKLELKQGTTLVVEGPADFEARSANSGFLRRGKLYATVPKQAIGFTLETPTAQIVDLGTEFSVEVAQDGITESRVFRGAIKVQPVATSRGQMNDERAVVVRENESIRIDKSLAADNRQTLTVRKETGSEPFVRDLPPPEKPLPMMVVAHFRMGEDDPSAVAGEAVGQQTIGQKQSRHLTKYGSPTYTSDAAPGSSLAMSFTAAADEYLFEQDLHSDYVDEIILEAWVRPNRAKNLYSLVVFNGRGFADGYGIGLWENNWALPCGGPAGWKMSETACEPGKWTHVALVRERGDLQIWINGRLAKDFGHQAIPMPSGAFSVGGAPKDIARIPNGFDGQIDEVRLSKFRPPFDPRMLLFGQSSKDTK